MTFFSGTDTGTLQSEGNDNNHFVSLIVNNAGVYTAAITRKVKESVNGTSKLEYDSFNAEHKEQEGTDVTFFKEYIEYYMLDVEVENSTDYSYLNDSALNDRFEELKTKPSPYYIRSNSSSRLPYEYNKTDYDVYPSLFYSPYTEEVDRPSEAKMTRYLKGMAAQIITGNIFSLYSSNINLQSWAANMPKLYSKRFKDMYAFENWATGFMDFLMDELYEFCNMEQSVITDATIDLYTILSQYPQNEYLNFYLQTLALV